MLCRSEAQLIGLAHLAHESYLFVSANQPVILIVGRSKFILQTRVPSAALAGRRIHVVGNPAREQSRDDYDQLVKVMCKSSAVGYHQQCSACDAFQEAVESLIVEELDLLAYFAQLCDAALLEALCAHL